jgi:competence protein ComEC
MIAIGAAFVLGAWWLQQQALLPGLTGAAGLVPLAVLALLLRRARAVPLRIAARALVLGACAMAGFHWAAAVATWKLGDALDPAWEGRDVELRGVVAEMPQPFERGVRFRFDVEQAFSLGATVPRHISLAWYRPEEGGEEPGFRAGQRWRLSARLRAPHGTVNPHGFDAEAWALERNLRAAGYVVREPAPRLEGQSLRPGYLVERAREALRARLQAALADRPFAGVIVALVVGDQQAIPPPQWQVFTRTGVNHLMSISGLHITMIASLAFLAVLRLWRRTRLALYLPALRAATVAGLLAAIAYAALAGFAVPAQRTIYMLAVVAVALWMGWSTRPAVVLAWAAAVAVAIDPMAVIAPGFWLSFGAVAVLMLAGAGRIRPSHWALTWLRAQWAITIALVPALLAMFQQVSLVSPLANAFAIPAISLVVVPLSLLAALVPVDALAIAAHAVMAACMVPLQWLSDLPAAVWQQHAPAAWTIPLAVAGAAWMLLPRGVPARWVGAFLFLPMLVQAPPPLAPGSARVTVLDVGQGLAVVVRTAGHALLFDAGPAFSGDIDAGERIVVPYLRGEGIAGLDAMVVSHDDLDHSGGALSVLRAMPVGGLASSLPDGHAIPAAAAAARRCVDGDAWEWDSVRFEMLNPEVGSYNFAELKDNDRSCVLRVVSAHGSLLLPADVERDAERGLLQRHGAGLRSDVLVIPHHGSRTSSTPAFVAAVAPRLAIVAAGYRNRFGHPHPAVVATYRRQGTRLLRTDRSGAIVLELGEGGLKTREWRMREPRYWRSRPDAIEESDGQGQ